MALEEQLAASSPALADEADAAGLVPVNQTRPSRPRIRRALAAALAVTVITFGIALPALLYRPHESNGRPSATAEISSPEDSRVADDLSPTQIAATEAAARNLVLGNPGVVTRASNRSCPEGKP